jgi:RNA polymerase sigma-70 factor (ECF subfamily)
MGEGLLIEGAGQMSGAYCFADDIIAAIPSLRAFALSLSGNGAIANDLVQETLLKAWAHQTSFDPGSNLKAWLFRILRNTYFSQYRSARREVCDDGSIAALVSVKANQHSYLDMLEFADALLDLPDEQREALILVGAEGYSYEETAKIAGCAIGTVKSRVSRARLKLARQLDLEASAGTADDANCGWSRRARQSS